ncbi:MAG: hypothetical protein RR478_03305 [Bacilli bacterium]
MNNGKGYYTSSSGELKEVETLDYQYLINALAKCYRAINESQDREEFLKIYGNLCNLESEIRIRNAIYFDEKFRKDEEMEII